MNYFRRNLFRMLLGVEIQTAYRWFTELHYP